MAENEDLQGSMDPELAALLGTDTQQHGDEPDLSSIFGDGQPKGIQAGADEAFGSPNEAQGSAEAQEALSPGFPEITKKLEDVPLKIFDDPNYYKIALTGEGDITQRVHGLLQKYINTKDPKDKGVFRQQLIPAFWEFLVSVARKAPGNIVEPKKFLLRFGILHPTFLNETDRSLFSKIVVENTLDQPVYYLDEWLRAVGNGVIKISSTDEANVAKSSQNVKLQQLLDKAKGKQDGAKTLLKAKDQERLSMERNIIARIGLISEHTPVVGLADVNSCYTEAQKRIFTDIQEIAKNLVKTDRELDVLIKEYQQADADVRSLVQKVEEGGSAAEVDVKSVDTEMDSVKQMAKMTIGRQGNHYPILTSEYFHCMPHEIGNRENVIAMLAKIESIDPEAYYRSYRNKVNRIVPYVLLIPSYGDSGMCWEPFDRHNRATSRGRIAVPMYPKSLPIAIMTAVADLRWQVAKEKASYYWMEEGITGNYYQWFQKMKLKGDLKEAFIQDYITWMTKESEGIQKLDKELRGVFWRHMPFAQSVKDKLKTRSFIYQELCQRDANRAMSDGY